MKINIQTVINRFLCFLYNEKNQLILDLYCDRFYDRFIVYKNKTSNKSAINDFTSHNSHSFSRSRWRQYFFFKSVKMGNDFYDFLEAGCGEIPTHIKNALE